VYIEDRPGWPFGLRELRTPSVVVALIYLQFD
jgi:hypothetical protein